jgi:hypothetical protein
VADEETLRVIGEAIEQARAKLDSAPRRLQPLEETRCLRWRCSGCGNKFSGVQVGFPALAEERASDSTKDLRTARGVTQSSAAIAFLCLTNIFGINRIGQIRLPMKINALQILHLAKRSSRLGVIALSLFLLSALTVSAATRKSTLYVATGTFGVGGTLYTIDATTGALLTTVGSLVDSAGNNYGMAGMKYNPLNRIFYGATSGVSPTNPSYLITINPATALVTPIGPFGAVLTDIAIDPRTGIMYGVSGFNQKFYSVNLTTGAATQIGSTGIGFQNGGGLAATSTGVLYGVNNFSTYTYSKTNGKATFIGLNLLPDLIRAADFDSRGTFYGLEGGGGTDNLHLRFLVTVNLLTGLGVEVGAIPIDDLDGLAFIPAR